MRILLSGLVAVSLMVALASPAVADPFGASPRVTPTFGKDNDHLRKILALQYQMQILKRLIERERIANNMVQAAVEVGVFDPEVPKPDRDLCAQVPGNIPCALAYSDLYADFSVKKTAPPPMLVAIDPPKSDDDTKEPVTPVQEAVVEMLGAQMFWTDITCLEEKCSAVISANPADPTTLFRVKVGETLPDGGVVSGISVNGVTLKRGNKEVKLEPAPAA
jgi:hypothetical protein